MKKRDRKNMSEGVESIKSVSSKGGGGKSLLGGGKKGYEGRERESFRGRRLW